MYVDWPAKLIFVEIADLTLVSPGPPAPVYALDTDWFRLSLKDLEDDVQGMAWPDTHEHTAPKTLAGVTYARFVEIINGYSVEFEDGAYGVNLVGSNNNIVDVVVINQVSVRPFNSAGLIQAGTGLTAEQAASLTAIEAAVAALGLDVASLQTDVGAVQTSVDGVDASLAAVALEVAEIWERHGLGPAPMTATLIGTVGSIRTYEVTFGGITQTVTKDLGTGDTTSTRAP